MLQPGGPSGCPTVWPSSRPHGDRTFAELNANINRLVRACRARGLRPGDAVALMCTNRPEFLEVLYAPQRSASA